jgi:hypothetical protein
MPLDLAGKGGDVIPLQLRLREEGEETTYEVKLDHHFLGLTPLNSSVKEPSVE